MTENFLWKCGAACDLMMLESEGALCECQQVAAGQPGSVSGGSQGRAFSFSCSFWLFGSPLWLFLFMETASPVPFTMSVVCTEARPNP